MLKDAQFLLTLWSFRIQKTKNRDNDEEVYPSVCKKSQFEACTVKSCCWTIETAYKSW